MDGVRRLLQFVGCVELTLLRVSVPGCPTPKTPETPETPETRETPETPETPETRFAL
jgi:hypothetical protein